MKTAQRLLAGSQIAPFDSGNVSSVRRCGRIAIKTWPWVILEIKRHSFNHMQQKAAQ
jgi:hypothetical protein